MKPRLIIGLMSGTSVDAIDAALVEVHFRAGRYRAKVLGHAETKWPREIRARLLRLMAPAQTTTQELCELNVLVAEAFGKAALKVIQAANLPANKITAIGSHGQTVCHLPPGPPRRVSINVRPSTLQLGDPSVIATLTGIPVVGNFRPADMAVGGQGAPLIPFSDDALLSHPKRSRCIQNIGGIANVTYLPRGQWSLASGQNVIAFDTGPGNMLLDALVSLSTNGQQKFDRNGRLAAKGSVDMKLFRRLQSHPYFERKPPKSTGREDFGLHFAQKLLATGQRPLTNLLATVTRLTAWSIADAYLHFLPNLPDEVIVCGGGADNPVLVAMLEEELTAIVSEFIGPQKIVVRRIDEFAIPNKAKEAAGFALLAAATLDGIAGNLPSVTGAKRGVILGVVAGANQH